MEVADEGHAAARVEEAFPDLGDGPRGLVDVHRDADELGARLRELERLPDRRRDVGRVRVRHGLHDDGRAAPDLHLSHPHADGLVARADRPFGHQKLTFFRTSK